MLFTPQKSAQEKAISVEEYFAAQESYFEMQKRAFEAAFLISDDEKQIEKGQPSLRTDDTGEQFLLEAGEKEK